MNTHPLLASGKHTPGPWIVGEEACSYDHRLVYIPICRGEHRISTTGVYGRKPDSTSAGRQCKDRPVITAEECRANAVLIAAAPDLLEACKRLIADASANVEENDATVAYDYTIGNRVMEAIRGAVAKAEGR